MIMLDYMVLYQSETGNTKKLATSIFAALPGMAKDLRSIDELSSLPEASTYFIGFCVHRGTCSLEIGNLLSTISGRNVALFGTCAPVIRTTTIRTSKTVHVSGWKMTMRTLEVSSVRVRCLCKSARNTNPCLMEMRSMTGI